jgi:glycosyltransferase involved in cell wall biosynthesis
MLKTTFSECTLETLDISALLRRRPALRLLNLFHALHDYGWLILTRKRRLADVFYRTPYLFRQVRKIVNAMYGDKIADYAFSFQLQSILDTRIAGLPNFVYTDHTYLENLKYPHFASGKFMPQAYIELEKTIYHHAVGVFTRSANITQSLIQDYHVPPEKITCVYCGSNARIITVPKVPGDYKRKHILFVGMDWERKGGPDLVEAFKLVLKKHPEAHLNIAGCSPRLDLPNITVMGKVPVEKIHEAYRRVSVFCMPTRDEPFNVAIIEAMSYHLPVVSSQIGAIPDFVMEGKNGHLVKPGDVHALAGALNDLLGDAGKCRAFGDESFRLVKEQYNWTSVGKRVRAAVLASGCYF